MDSVSREDDVKLVGLGETLGFSVLRIGVTDNSGRLEVQDFPTWQINALRETHE